MVDLDRESGFPSNFDMPRPNNPRKAKLQPIKLPNGLLYPRVEVEQRTHSGDEVGPICHELRRQFNFTVKYSTMPETILVDI